MEKKYYMLETNGSAAADLYIFGDITSYPWSEADQSAYGIVKELQELNVDTIRVHINSYGGEVAEGLAIYNVLKNHPAKVVTCCDGFACSAASVIFMAGEERIMNEASLLMIHNAWSYACGNAEELRKQAEDLDKITGASINAYMSGVNISREEVVALMDDETWLTADEAVNYGFATGTADDDIGVVNQSAFMAIRNRLMMKQPRDIVEDAAEKLRQIADTLKREMPQKENTISQVAEQTNQWAAFFNTTKS